MQNSGFEIDTISIIQQNLADRYTGDDILTIVKEFLQNADDANASSINLGVISLAKKEGLHPLLQGPALCVINDGSFTESDNRAIRQIASSAKANEEGRIGKFGLGLKSAFHLCEAFAYFSSNKEIGDGILNPWNQKGAHPDWEAVPTDANVSDVLASLSPITNRYGHWFCIWIPLRTRKSLGAIEPITSNFIGDQKDPLSLIMGGDSIERMAALLPLLGSLTSISVWDFSSANSLGEESIRISNISHPNNGLGESCGEVLIEPRGGNSSVFIYSQSNTDIKEPELTSLSESSDWPTIRSIDSTTFREITSPEKAVQRGGSMFVRSPSVGDGFLKTHWSITLPVGEAEAPQEIGGKWDYHLFLDGAFFTDPGRTGVMFSESGSSNDPQRVIKANWNSLVRDRATLPTLIPTLESLCTEFSLADDEIGALSRAIQDSDLLEKHRLQICNEYQWLYRIHPNGGFWESAPSDLDLIYLPRPSGVGEDLLWQVFPNLANIHDGKGLTFSDMPSVSLQNETKVPNEQDLLSITKELDISLFQNSNYIRYFVELLEYMAVKELSWKEFKTRLSQSVGQAIKTYGVARLRTNSSLIKRLATFLPGQHTFFVKVGNAPADKSNLICDALSALDTSTLFLPEAFNPQNDLTENVVLSLDEAAAVLQCLSSLKSHDDLEEYLSIVASQVIQSVDPHHKDQLLHKCGHLSLFSAYDASIREGRQLTINEMKASYSSWDMFCPPDFGKRYELADVFQSAIPGSKVLVMKREDFSAIFDDESLRHCNEKNVCAALRHHPNLGSPERRRELLVFLLNGYGNSVSDFDEEAILAIRYLLHGRHEEYDTSEELILNDGQSSSGIWERLLEKALMESEKSWKVINSSFSDVISRDPYYDLLSLTSLKPQSVFESMSNVDPNLIGIESVTQDEYNEILLNARETAEYETIRSLPIHRTISGEYCSVGEFTFLKAASAVEAGTLSDIVRIVERSSDPRVANIQYEYIFRRKILSPVEALKVALQGEHPKRHWKLILKHLQDLESVAPEDELSKTVRTAQWIPTKEERFVCPNDILYIESLTDQISQVLANGEGEFVGLDSIPKELSNSEGFNQLLDKFVPGVEDALSMMAEYISGDANNLIGEVDPSSLNLEVFSRVFQRLPSRYMRSYPLTRSILEKIPHSQSVNHFLPDLCQHINAERYIAILNHIAEEHRSAPSPKKREVLDLHIAYLKAASSSPEWPGVLRELLLLNLRGSWCKSKDLCQGIEGADEDFIISEEHESIIGHGGSRITQSWADTGDIYISALERYERMTDHELREALMDSSADLVSYFSEWTDYSRNEVIGGFLMMLGDEPQVRYRAESFLGNWTVESRRNLMGWKNPFARFNDFNQVMANHRFIVRIIDTLEQGSMQGSNLLGEIIDIPFDQGPYDNLLLGENLFTRTHIRGHIYLLQLRKIDPSKLSRSELSSLLKNTSQKFLKDVFQGEATKLDELWDQLDSSEQLDIDIAQTRIIDAAPEYIRRLNVSSNSKMSGILQIYEDGRDMHAEMRHATGKERERLSRESEKRTDQALKRIEEMFKEDVETNNFLLETVRTKISKEFQYTAASVPFEIFQNADDAMVQLFEMFSPGTLPDVPNIFVAGFRDNHLFFAHWGRPINQVSRPGFADGKSRGFGRDLTNMLMMNISSKSIPNQGEEVTGKFGLGFKGVFLITDKPKLLSSDMAVEIRAGMYPHKLDINATTEIRNRMADLGYGHPSGTYFELKNDRLEEGELFSLLEEFSALAGILTIFSKRINQCQIISPHGENKLIAWDGKEVLGLSNLSTGTFDYKGETLRGLIFRNDVGSILFSIGAEGFLKLPQGVPNVWVTAPTSHKLGLGIAVNGPFQLDIGRAQLARDPEENKRIAVQLSVDITNTILEFHKFAENNWDEVIVELGLSSNLSHYQFWESFWNVGISVLDLENREGPEVRLINTLLWGEETGIFNRLIRVQKAIPSKLPGSYRTLVSMPDVRYRTTGLLDRVEDLFLLAEQTGVLSEKYPPGSLVSSSRIGRLIDRVDNSLSNPHKLLDLKTILVEILSDSNQVNPEAAGQAGILINREILESEDVSSSAEAKSLIDFLHTLQFQAQGGHYVSSEQLLTLDSSNADESMRAEFAPRDRLLSRNYKDTAFEFFLTCRRRLEAPSSEIRRWARAAKTAKEKHAVLRYLANGELRDQVGSLLEGNLNGSWLVDFNGSEYIESLDTGEQARVQAALIPNQVVSQFGQPYFRNVQSPSYDPESVLKKIKDWWGKESEKHIGAYEQRVFPDGTYIPISDNLQESAAREGWIELFGLSTLHRAGRLTEGQRREFIRRMRKIGLTRSLSDSDLHLVDKISPLLSYFEQMGDTAEHYHSFVISMIPMLQISNWLDDYCELILGFERRVNIDLNQVLSPSADPAQQGGGINAPTLTKALGYGICFLLRELMRQGVLSNAKIIPHCYCPTGGVRDLLEEIGMEWDITGATSPTNSRNIYEFISTYLGEEDATFGGTFDLPLLVLASNPALKGEIFL